MSGKIDSELLRKAKYEYDKDKEKLIRYDILPVNHITEKDMLAHPELTKHKKITPMLILNAAKVRETEYDKDLKSYIKELEIATAKLEAHSPQEIIKSHYRRFESGDIALLATMEEDPFTAILEIESAI